MNLVVTVLHRISLQAGVLSEDLIYDSITELRDTAFTMLEMGAERNLAIFS